MRFLSDRNIELHKEYLNNLILKYNVFEKSYPMLKSAKNIDIKRLKIPISEREEAARLYAEISAHKIYFNSFCEQGSRSEWVKEAFRSEASFIYELYLAAIKCEFGFLIVYEDRGRICYYAGQNYADYLFVKNIFLAIDLCEHSYFYDYGFKKEDYLRSALSHLNLSKIEKSMK